MASIKLIVKSKAKNKPSSLYIRFINGRETDLFAALPFKIYPELWSNKTNSFKQRITYSDTFTEEDRLNYEEDFHKLKRHILDSFNKFVMKGYKPDKDWLKDSINEYYNQPKIKEETLNQFIDRFISEAENGNRLYTHNHITKRYEYSTLKNFKGFQVQFDEYQKEKKKVLNFDHITIDFYDAFLAFFNKKGYSPNTIGRHIKNLKTIMRAARDEGLHSNNEIERKKFSVLRSKVENIYNNEDELNRMYLLDLSDNPDYELARDVYLIGCYTLQRFSDYSRINENNIIEINGRKVIKLIQKKTGEIVMIPVRPRLEALLAKYKYNVPKIYEQKLNRDIKHVGEKAKIKEKIEIESIKGGLKTKETISKYKLIKTHTARRSGCTNMYKAGVPVIDIMKISGHKSEREFLNYIKLSKEETAIKMLDHPYFNQSAIAG